MEFTAQPCSEYRLTQAPLLTLTAVLRGSLEELALMRGAALFEGGSRTEDTVFSPVLPGGDGSEAPSPDSAVRDSGGIA